MKLTTKEMEHLSREFDKQQKELTKREKEQDDDLWNL